jgi:hypothetical protein
MITITVLQLIGIIALSAIVGGVAFVGATISICEYIADRASSKKTKH